MELQDSQGNIENCLEKQNQNKQRFVEKNSFMAPLRGCFVLALCMAQQWDWLLLVLVSVFPPSPPSRDAFPHLYVLKALCLFFVPSKVIAKFLWSTVLTCFHGLNVFTWRQWGFTLKVVSLASAVLETPETIPPAHGQHFRFKPYHLCWLLVSVFWIVLFGRKHTFLRDFFLCHWT